MRTLTLVLALCSAVAPAAAQSADLARWQHHARNVTITRDDWGIAHVVGQTDADVVFGMLYTQAEDDFNRVETNYINALGRLAEAEGEAEIYRDLRMKLFIDPADLQAKYAASPEWLRKLMDAFADGLNYYLYKNPTVSPRVIKHFEPWMALAFSEGSIGGDIERVSIPNLAAFYGRGGRTPPPGRSGGPGDGPAPSLEPAGSNGIAIAPSITSDRRALLLINPHTSFFFRSELQMTSSEGLNAYGAVTWGQFFVYQGFNDSVGWMHTSSGVDVIDEYLETVIERGGRYYYRYGEAQRPVTVRRITVPYRTPGGMAAREFTVFATHHGPVVRRVDGKWVSVQLMQRPVEALTQSYMRTKAADVFGLRKTMELFGNSSNNTLTADRGGNIAYFHVNFVPRRDARFDWSQPVDGSNPATDWQAPHRLDELPHVINPPNGWVYNTNNWPYSAAGAASPRKENFPAYMDRYTENYRGLHAIRLLESRKDFTLTSLIDAAYDSYLTGFAAMIPPLVRAYDALSAGDARKRALAEQIGILRSWDYRWSAASVPTSLAVFWAEELGRLAGPSARSAGVPVDQFIATGVADSLRLRALVDASARLVADFGKWQTAWGEINRFQRLTGDIVQPFSDSGPSIPVPFTSARWGSLASFGARPYPNTKRWYGTSGNSFVAVVQFGRDSVRARAVTAGGESGDPRSPHFNDQAQRYADGNLREVYFYPSQLRGHTERVYHP